MSHSPFRVALFGSARLQLDSREYQDVYTISRDLTQRGISVVCVGGPGLMEACRCGRDQALSTSEASAEASGVEPRGDRTAVSCENLVSHFQHFTRRMDRFLTESQGIIVAPGGIGTLLELFYCLHSCQVRKVTPPPILLFGPGWRSFMAWWNEHLLARGLVSPEDSAPLTCFDDAPAVIRQIDQWYQQVLVAKATGSSPDVSFRAGLQPD